MGLGPSLPPAELARHDLVNFRKCSSLFLVHRTLASGASNAGPSVRLVMQRGAYPVLVTGASDAEKAVSTGRVTSASGVSGSDAKKCSCTDRTLVASDQYLADVSGASRSSLVALCSTPDAGGLVSDALLCCVRCNLLSSAILY
jgi:hypothetical protein